MSSTFAWSTPFTLSPTTVDSSDPRVVIDPNGNIVSIWLENSFVKSSTKLVNSNWSSPVTLSNSSSSSPIIVIDSNGNATTVWVENGIIKASSKVLTGTWTSPITLSTSGASAPALTVDVVGNLIAVWSRNGNIESSTRFFGSPWQNKVVISGNNTIPNVYPRVAFGGSGLNTQSIIIWHSTSTNLVYTSNKLIAGTWSSPQAISDSTRTSAYANIAIDSNLNAIAIWYAYTPVGNNYLNVVVQSTYRSNTNGLWSSINNLSSPGIYNPANLSVNIKFDGNGNAIATWNTSFDGSTFTVQSAVKPVKDQWLPATDIVNSLYSLKVESDISLLGQVLSTFMFYNGTSLSVLASEANLSGYNTLNWSVPLNVSTGTNNGFSRIAVAQVGNVLNAVIIWSHYNGSHNIIRISTGIKTLVIPPSNLSITQNSNNFGIFTEYYNKLQWTVSTDPNLTGYAIFRNGIFINLLSPVTTQYTDNNQQQNGPAIYGIAAINNQQSQSVITKISFP